MTAVSGSSETDIWGDENEPIHLWFSLSYANYLVLPRSVLQSMPVEWQRQFCRMLDQAHAAFPDLEWPRYTVSARNDAGQFISDPIPHYNRGRTKLR